MAHRTPLENAWSALGREASELDAVEAGHAPSLTSPLAVGPLVRDAVAAASIAAASLTGARRRITLDGARIRTAVTSDRVFRLDGVAPDVWGDLSGFWAASDGWVRTHANYRHHRERLLEALGLATDSSPDDFARTVAALPAQNIEDAVARVGGLAARVRTPDEWMAHPQAAVIATEPLIGVDRHGERAPHTGTAQAPLAGVRVLDLTRVLAGPVCTRSLALLGADVLRVDSPLLPEPEWQHLDSGAGKRTTLLDISADRTTFDELLRDADVLVLGYRSGSLDRFGLSPRDLAETHPSLVVASVTAWGDSGPWSSRRGFDSIVQAASGIASIHAVNGKPGALPAQALDHSAGYLLAAGIMTALGEGSGATVAVSLARLAHELLDAEQLGLPDDDGRSTTTTLATSLGEVTLAQPALVYEGGPTEWPAAPHPLGSDAPTWRNHA